MVYLIDDEEHRLEAEAVAAENEHVLEGWPQYLHHQDVQVPVHARPEGLGNASCMPRHVVSCGMAGRVDRSLCILTG